MMMNPLSRSLASCLLALALLLPAPSRAQTPPASNNDLVEIQMPNNPVNEVISFYELLTGLRLIRDANLAGGNISILVNGKIQKRDAIALIESALLLNGYSIVPMGNNVAKILGPGRSPLGESIPLYADPSLLPPTEELASYFMLLNYISPQDALSVFNAYVSLRPQGTIVAVPNSNALVITDTTTLIRRLIHLQRFIDVPGARILTEFISLARADAEKVAEMVNKILEDEKQADKATAVPVLDGGQPPAVETAGSAAGSPGAAAIKKLAQIIKIIPDTRTNRILVVAPENRMAYLHRLIRDLDSAVSLEQTLQRQLNFVSAGEVLPVLESILAEGDDAQNSSSQSSSTSRQPSSQNSSSSSRSSSGSSSSGSSSSSRSGGGTSSPDMLSDPREDTSPQAISVGKARIIADRSLNKIIVIGPPEVRSKASQVLDLLDRRPKQIYLATIIGQLSLTDDLNIGFDYLIKFNQLNQNLGGAGMLRNTGVDVLPDPSSIIANNVFPAASQLGGLTLLGTVSESIDVFAHALEKDGKFKIISRPVVYTANNKKALISSGEEVPYAANTVSSAIQNNTTGITSNTSFKDVLLKLEVVPLINSDEEVTLTIAQQNDSVLRMAEISQGNKVPVIGTQKLTTTVSVKNRSTIVLGGLIKEQDDRTQSGLPFLSNIPGLNYFFSNTDKKKARSELIILIQPFIINNPTDLYDTQEDLRASSRLADEIIQPYMPEIRKAESVFPVNPEPRTTIKPNKKSSQKPTPYPLPADRQQLSSLPPKPTSTPKPTPSPKPSR